MGTSTLQPWLSGTKIHGRTVRGVTYGDRKARTRAVLFTGGRGAQMDIPVLQDLLLLEKGYPEGKYSGLSPEQLRALKRKPERKRKQRKSRA